jgi:uncharacterized protein (UPF0210 family)
MPVTIPEVFTLATVASLVDHVPPVTVELSVVVVPVQIVVTPLNVPAAGAALTVMVAVALALPQALETV